MNWAWAAPLDPIWRSPSFPMWLTLGAAGFFAIIVLVTILRSEKSVATGALTGAALAAIPLAFVAEGMPLMVRPESWAALFGIGLVSTSFSFLLMYRLLPRVGATNFTITTFIAPVSAIILGISLLHEVMTPLEISGIAVIFAGLVIMDGRLVRKLRRAAPA